jgi:hypothetical protein
LAPLRENYTNLFRILFGDEVIVPGMDVEKNILKGRFQPVVRHEPVVWRLKGHAGRRCLRSEELQVLEA